MKTTNILHLGTISFLTGFFLAFAMQYSIEFISYDQFKEKLYQEETMIVELWAEWNEENESKNLELVEGINKYRINVEIYPEIIDDYSIKSIPTFLFIRGGEEIYRYQAGIDFKGDLQKEDFENILKDL